LQIIEKQGSNERPIPSSFMNNFIMSHFPIKVQSHIMRHVESAQVPWQIRKEEEHVNGKGLWPLIFFGQKLSKQLFESGIFYYKFPNFGLKKSKRGGLNFYFWEGVTTFMSTNYNFKRSLK
jgi:hypothetical protein